MRRFLCMILICSMVSISILGCSMINQTDSVKEEETTVDLWELAKTTPYGKYPETVTYTLGKEIGGNNSNMPEGDTYEDNAYTRYLLEKLNIKNINAFESMNDKYNTDVSMAIAMDNIPDIMVVNSLSDVTSMYNMGMLADLTESYENCASDRIKAMLESYGEDLLDSVKFDGKIMAIPETNIAEGPNLLWLRADWMRELDLDEPKTLEDVENIISKFIEEDESRVGIVAQTFLCGESGYSSQYLTDVIFADFGGFPKQWLMGADGVVKYGSVQLEIKSALSYMNELYEKEILDKDFLFRTSGDIIKLIETGKCGSFFGPWWSPNNPLLNIKYKDKSADWKPYLISTEDNGVTSYHSTNPTNYKYVVVSKSCKHPEIAFKIISILFDYARYEDLNDANEISEYDKNAVDPTARPLVINIDYKNALEICYNNISDVINGKKEIDELNSLEGSYAEQCMNYLEHKGNETPQEWAAYVSRIEACSLISKENVKEVKSLYFSSTPTMDKCWWNLKELESDAFLRIITGQVDIDYFDTFVEEWYSRGGQTITKEVNDYYNNK